MMERAPKGLRLHVALLGRRNVGKSSLLNALSRQSTAIVSPTAGTTTDPVEKPMELLPLGPVVLVDTAGVDDTGELGERRVARTRSLLDRLDLAIVVAGGGVWGPYEQELVAELGARRVPYLVAFNQSDLGRPPGTVLRALDEEGVPHVETVAPDGIGIAALREALLARAPEHALDGPPLCGDLVSAGQCALLVVPIDKEAPRGRLILPQVQAIRDLLDHDAVTFVTKESTLGAALAMLRDPPRLVVTDSQAFATVAAATPRSVPLTSFSILMSRVKGDLPTQVEGTAAIDDLQPGDRVLVAEACTHHPIGEDIGRVKIPRWLAERAGAPVAVDFVQGHDFPEDLAPYRLVVLCGSCMLGRREVLRRVLRCREAGVPVSNYGLTIAHCVGILERALEPFPEARAAWRCRRERKRGTHDDAA